MVDNLSPMKLLTLGYPVIPSGGGTSGKAPLVNWQQYQNEYPMPDDILRWQDELNPNLWGIVTGAIPGSAFSVLREVKRDEQRTRTAARTSTSG